ncbi:MAG: hypothetical protein ACKO2P_05305, partial [Planctomycetota bacterium]
ASRSSEACFVTALILRTRKRIDGPGRSLLAPFGRITLRYPDGLLVRYEDYRHSNPLRDRGILPGSPIGIFPHPTIAAISPRDYLAYRRLLSQKMLGLFAGSEFDDEMKRLWGLLMEPALTPYYWLIGPRCLRTFLAPGNGPQADEIVSGQPDEDD